MEFPRDGLGKDPQPDVFGTDSDRPHDLAAREMLPAREPRNERPQTVLSVKNAIEACGLRDGATLSFHHHLRDGDAVLNQVLSEAAAIGLRALTIAASSIFPVHAPLTNHIASGVVSRIVCDYVKGPVASAIGSGLLPEPALLQTHGGRARSISSGQLKIDAAFIAAPHVDRFGAATGSAGRASCGPLGYAMVDADYADKVVLISEGVSDEIAGKQEIGAGKSDFLVVVPTIGDNSRILSGATAIAGDPVSRAIVDLTLQVIDSSGLLSDGFSFQTGAGGISLGVASKLGTLLAEKKVRGGFISGGIAAGHVALLEAGLFDRIHDVQCFDLEAVRSYERNARHEAMSASRYASPIDPDPVVSHLDVVVLGAAEIDRHFNVNVATGGNGSIIGGPGGHPDTAAGAKLTIVTTRLTAGGHPKVVEKVLCRVTPGDDVDVVVTEAGVAVNPRRGDLLERFRRSGVPIKSIDDLRRLAALDSSSRKLEATGHVVAFVEHRSGTWRETIPKYTR